MVNRERETFEHKKISIKTGVDMYTRISAAPPVPDASSIVLVHGLSVSSGYMMPTAMRLASCYRVYVPDLPGFGRSQKPRHIFTVAELTDALFEWTQAAGLSSAVFLGNSLGCQIIVNLALHHPDLVERAILISPTMDPVAPTKRQQAYHLFQDAHCEPLHFLPVLLREYCIAGVKRTICTLQYALDDRMEEHLPHVAMPVLVVRGSEDPIVSQKWVERICQLLPDGRLVVIQGAGHAVNFNSPDELTAHVCAFVEDSRCVDKQ